MNTKTHTRKDTMGSSTDSRTAPTNQKAFAHTPGPWRTAGYGYIESVAADLPSESYGRPIAIPVPVAKVVDHRQVSEGTKIANARLIAAAPDLLAVCKAIAADASAYQWHATINALIAKVEGR